LTFDSKSYTSPPGLCELLSDAVVIRNRGSGLPRFGFCSGPLSCCSVASAGARRVGTPHTKEATHPRAEMHVSRRKAGKPATRPIRGDELRELRKLRKESTGSFVFVSERGAPFTPASFNWMIKRAGQKAGLPFQDHAHMLRHSAGYKLAGDGCCQRLHHRAGPRPSRRAVDRSTAAAAQVWGVPDINVRHGRRPL
jgi:hypothetical protein